MCLERWSETDLGRSKRKVAACQADALGRGAKNVGDEAPFLHFSGLGRGENLGGPDVIRRIASGVGPAARALKRAVQAPFRRRSGAASAPPARRRGVDRAKFKGTSESSGAEWARRGRRSRPRTRWRPSTTPCRACSRSATKRARPVRARARARALVGAVLRAMPGLVAPALTPHLIGDAQRCTGAALIGGVAQRSACPLPRWSP